MRVAVVASAQIFGGFQNLPPPQSLDFSAFFGLSHLFPPRLSISVIFDTDLVTSQLSVHCQTLSVLAATPLSARYYLKGKTLQALLSLLLALPALPFLFP